jgi:hypothetical protein
VRFCYPGLLAIVLLFVAVMREEKGLPILSLTISPGYDLGGYSSKDE